MIVIIIWDIDGPISDFSGVCRQCNVDVTLTWVRDESSRKIRLVRKVHIDFDHQIFEGSPRDRDRGIPRWWLCVQVQAEEAQAHAIQVPGPFRTIETHTLFMPLVVLMHTCDLTTTDFRCMAKTVVLVAARVRQMFGDPKTSLFDVETTRFFQYSEDYRTGVTHPVDIVTPSWSEFG